MMAEQNVWPISNAREQKQHSHPQFCTETRDKRGNHQYAD